MFITMKDQSHVLLCDGTYPDCIVATLKNKPVVLCLQHTVCLHRNVQGLLFLSQCVGSDVVSYWLSWGKVSERGATL